MLILAAFATVASAFGAVVMTTGLAGSRQVDQTLSSALRRTTSGLALQGGVLAESDGSRITTLIVDVTTSTGSQGVNLDANATLDRTIVAYNDDSTLLADLPYTVSFLRGDGDTMLESGELAQMRIDLTRIEPPVTAGHSFVIQVKPPESNYLIFERTIPASGAEIDRFVNLR
jgi:archaellin